jgi:hypothetical protein
MLRDIPSRGNEEIDLYMRTYYSLLRSTSDIRVRSLEETHCATDSSLHIGADEPTPAWISRRGKVAGGDGSFTAPQDVL